MVENSQKIRPLFPTNCLSVTDHFLGLALTLEFKNCSLTTGRGGSTTTFSILFKIIFHNSYNEESYAVIDIMTSKERIL